MRKILFLMVFCFTSFTILQAKTSHFVFNGSGDKLNPRVKGKSQQAGLSKKRTAFSSPYYVSPTGNDAASGTSSATPFKTISKAASVAQSGDVVYIMRGVYRETVTPNSGTTFTKYNNDKVVIMGTDSVSNWQPYKNGIYKAYVHGAVTQLCVNNVMGSEARYPNSNGNNLSTSSWANVSIDITGNATITDPSSPANYWVGADFVGIVASQWVAVGGIIDQSGTNSLHCTTRKGPWPTTYSASYIGSGKGYITHCLRALDTVNEWHWQNDTLYYYPQSPSNLPQLNIQARKRINGFDLSSKSNIHITGLNFLFANINMEKASNCTIDGVNVLYPTPYSNLNQGFNRGASDNLNFGISNWQGKGVAISGSNNVIKNSYIAHSWGDGISVGGTSNTINNCLVEDANWAGSDCAAVATIGSGHNITNSTLRNTGRSVVVHRKSDNTNITHNEISDAGYITRDLGLTYTYQSNGHGSQIAYNWVHDNHGATGNDGIYLDNSDTLFVVHHNVIWKTLTAIRTNKPGVDHQIYNNTAWLCTNSMGTSGPGSIVNQTVRNNLSDKAWSIYTTQSNNLVTATPGFTNVAANDYSLQSTSPAVDYGVAIPGITDGYLGTAPDAGAYEYGSTKWIAGSSVTASTIAQILSGTGTGPVISLTSPANHVSVSASAAINIMTNVTDADGLITKVDFYNGNTLLGTSTAAPYNHTWSNAPAGSDTLTAVATDSNGLITTSLPITITVIPPPTVSITAPANNSVIVVGSNVTISANASSPNQGGSITKVDFYNRSTLLGTVTTAPYNYTWNNVTAATDTLRAVATDNNGFTTTSSAVIIAVKRPPSALSYTGPNVYTKGTTITSLSPTVSGDTVITYSVSPALPAGLSLNTGTGVISGTPTAITSTATYTITATNSAGSTSGTVIITVKDIAPSALSYTGPNVYTTGTTIISLSPTVSGGTVISYSVSPALPAGLSLNTGTGVISGTPTTVTSATTYTITATNSGGSTTGTVSITVKMILPVADAYVQGGTYSSTNYGTVTPLIVKNVGVNSAATREAYLKFDMHGVIPQNLINAKLQLYGGGDTGGNTVKITVSKVADNTWTETGITYNNRPAATVALDSIPGRTSNAYSLWDITSAVKNMSSDSILSLKVWNTTIGSSSSDVSFASRELSWAPQRPTIIFTLGTSGNNMNSFSSTYVPGDIAAVNPKTTTTPVVNTTDPHIIVHQALSPNGDGVNDFFLVEGLQDHPTNHVLIVNHSGEKVFETNNYNSTDNVFSGRSSHGGGNLPAGTYYYVIDYRSENNQTRLTGFIILKY